MSFIVSFILYVLVEAPCANLDKALLGNLKIFPYPREEKTAKSGNVETGIDGEPSSNIVNEKEK